MEKHKLISIFILIICVILIIQLVQSNLQLLQQGSIVDRFANQQKQLLEENKQLKKLFSQVQTEEFVEKEARDKLNMGKPGETVVIISDSLLATKSASAAASEVPIWEKWKRLFF
jgi:cell division protein FtsB